VLVIVALALLLVLPTPWNFLGACISFLSFGGELALWNRTVLRRSPQAGAETLIGRTGKAISDCRPLGQIRLDGEIWEARCSAGVGTGEPVVVTGRDQLVLLVEPAESP
jgi:membrane protein implicated in regulation of membrane protease activity